MEGEDPLVIAHNKGVLSPRVMRFVDSCSVVCRVYC